MFAYIKGNLEEKASNFVVIDVSGIGYKIFMSDSAIQKIGEIGEIVKVHTHYYVREDNISLYGFLSNDELKMFELLLQVSGIGAKSAIIMLSNITPSNFVLAVITNDVSKLTKIPGIGAKTAQRIILELKDKLKTESAASKTEETRSVLEKSEVIDEAISALQILGYNKKEIEKALEKIDKTNITVEELIKKGLTILSIK
ncbi:MAG: Holliday junction branch migration protein RuvA [Clostridia bacterium]|jgi:Holliday junction DNA helicase RuvA|nr:Holliday junction branch migration protein RuvA [Clostridia bacterium]